MCHNETEQLGNIKFHVELKKKTATLNIHIFYLRCL